MPVTKGEVKQGREELEDDEIDLEDKENEDIGEDGKSMSLRSWISVKAWKELNRGLHCNNCSQ